MTPGSLGLRTPSYGSLQHAQQQQQQLLLLQQHHQYQHHQLNGAAAAGVQAGSAGSAGGASASVVAGAASVGGRKNGKMLLAAGRDKERFLPWICKMAGRRKVGMLLLAVISLVVFASILAVFNKDEEIPEGPEMNMHPFYPLAEKSKKSPVVSPSNGQKATSATGSNTSSLTELQRITDRQIEIKEPLPYFNLSLFASEHPCEHFSLPPPPPPSNRRVGPRPCDVCYIPVEHAIAYTPTNPSESPVLKDLRYYSEHNSAADQSNGGSLFGGHQSLQQRKDSFDIKESMTVHCGFFKGNKPGIGGQFDIDEADLLDMEQCRGVVVASAIFGNYDVMQQPRNISEITKRHACFFMFVDEETEAYLRNRSELDDSRKSGIWKVVVVHNLPYTDARRNGKVPKLLLHRLFPNARYSLWIDGKLELVVDPFQLLERFLWRKNATFAISRHYTRFDVFVEAEANKAAGKYDNATIDQQIEFYKNEGLTHYSEAKLPITSDVPEGCVIIREHIPITNLFTCLWFNEVDRFTSRDQLSFSTVRDKIMSKTSWTIEMFLDCERRNFVIQAYHRDVMKAKLEQVHTPPLQRWPDMQPRKVLPGKAPDKPSKALPPPSTKKPSVRRGRDRKSGSKHHRPRAANGRDSNSL